VTTPHQSSPDGAITIGGGEWMYGQAVNEATARSAFELPMPTPDNMLELLRVALEMLDLDTLKPFAEFLGVVDGVFTNITEAVDAILGSLVIKPVLQTVEAFTEWLTDTFEPLLNLFNALVKILTGDFSDIPTALEGVGTWLTDLIGSIPLIGDIVEAITGIAGGALSDLTDWANGLATQITEGIQGLIHALTGILHGDFSDVEEWVSNLGSLVLMGVSNIIEAITGIVGGTLEDLAEWVTTIPIVGDIVEAITGVFGNLGDLAQWFADNVLTILSGLPAWNLIGQIPDAVMGILNIGHLTTEPVNLLQHPNFEDASTVAAVDGWSWDSTQTANSIGGSAKVVLDGYNKELNHQTAVRVAPGDKMTVGAKFKSSGITGTGWKAAVSVMEYRNGAIATPVEIVSRTTNSASWVLLAGDYTVPPNVSSVVFRLTVENATSGTAWFDELNFHKSGILEQGWVENLPNTWENFWGGLVGTPGTGKTWADMGDAGTTVRNNALIGISGANAANGNLQTTWNSFYDAHAGTSGATGQTPSSAAAAAGGVRTTAVSASGTASTAYGTATTASGNVQDTWNKLWEAVFGGVATGKTAADAKSALNATASTASGASSTASTASGAASTANTNLQDTWNKLFDAFNGTAGSTGKTATQASTAGGGVRTTATSAASSASAATTNANSALTKANGINTTLFGSTSGGSTVTQGALPLTTILPTSGSGAQISRRNTTNVNGATGRLLFPTGFFDYQDRASSNITTTLSEGKFTVSESGWYMVELAFRLNPTISFGFSVAPLLFKGTSSSQSPFKIGNDAIMGTWGFGSMGNRYANSSWIVYLNAGEAVRAGYDGSGTGVDIFDADASGIETYFSISMMNKSFA